MTFLRLGDPSLAWMLEAVRLWLLVFGCALCGWAVGFGMGYRRGVNDAISDQVFQADHRFNGE